MSRSSRIRFVTRKSSRIAYDPGEREGLSPTALVVIGLHALLADHTELAALRGPFANDVRFIFPDARGHGASPTLQNQWFSMAELAADVVSIMDAESLDSVHLMGHGLGGATAYEVVRRHPERVKSLTLIQPELGSLLDRVVDADVRTARANQRTSDRDAGDAAYKQLVDRSLDLFFNPRWGKDWRSRVSKSRSGAVRRHAPALAGIVPAIDSYDVNAGEASPLTMPILLIEAANASQLERPMIAELKKRHPQATVQTIDLGDPADGLITGSIAENLATILRTFLEIGE